MLNVCESISFLFFCFFVSLDIILSWRAHHDDRFPNLPKFDYRSAKTSNNAVASMSLTVTSQSPSLFYFSFSLPSFHPYDLKLRIKTQVMCFNRKHAQQIYGKEKKTALGGKKNLDSDLCVVYIGIWWLSFSNENVKVALARLDLEILIIFSS